MMTEKDFPLRRPFKETAIGERFWCNGNIWQKKSSRTAIGLWPACLPKWAYFGQSEMVNGERSK